MEKFVPLFKPFMPKFYFKIFERGKVLSRVVKSWRNLHMIWIYLKFEFESNFTTPHGTVASGLPASGSFSPVFLSEPDPSPRAPCSASSVAARARRLRVATSQCEAPSPFLPLYLSPSPFYSSLLSKRKLLLTPTIAAPPQAPVTRRHTPSCRREAIKRVRAHLLPLPELTASPSTLGADWKSSFPHHRLERCCHLTGLHWAPSCRQRRRLPRSASLGSPREIRRLARASQP
jgi:hypothetical protein